MCDSRGAARVRRCVDLLVVLAVAPLVLPIVVVCAALIVLESPGPVFYVHMRVGRGGRTFGVVKLRTMVSDAASRQSELVHLNARPWPDFKIADDPRVTRVGRVLRETSLDELPQLWSVLTGEMTLVGPRPCSVATDRYALWQTERLEATPGLFGTWQAGHRGSADFATRCRLDIAQVRHRSPQHDIDVSLRSVFAVLRRQGAE